MELWLNSLAALITAIAALVTAAGAFLSVWYRRKRPRVPHSTTSRTPRAGMVRRPVFRATVGLVCLLAAVVILYYRMLGPNVIMASNTPLRSADHMGYSIEEAWLEIDKESAVIHLKTDSKTIPENSSPHIGIVLTKSDGTELFRDPQYLVKASPMSVSLDLSGRLNGSVADLARERNLRLVVLLNEKDR